MDWQLHHDLLNQFPFPLLTLNETGRIVEVNSAMEQLTGYEAQALSGMSFTTLLPEHDAVIAEKQLQLLKRGNVTHHETDIIGKDGGITRLQLVLLPLMQRGKLTAVHVISGDLTRTAQIEHELMQTQEQMNNIFETLDVSIWSVDVQENKLLHLSPGTEKIYGRTLSEFRENPMLWNAVIHHEDRSKVDLQMQNLAVGQAIAHEYRIIHPDGGIHWIYARTIPQLREDGKLSTLTGIIIDITERKTLEMRVQLLAYHDALTGLPNRKQFEEMVEKEIEEAEQTGRTMALLTLHVNRYKQINDTLGDQIADESIRILAERIAEHVPNGTIVARIREDDFAVLLNNTEQSEHSPAATANRLIQAAGDLFHAGSFEFHLFANIGVCLFPEDCSDRQSMINHSAIALNRAKQQGINNVQRYTSAIDMESYRNYTLERDLYKAIERGEFTLLYQPKVDTYSHKIVGVEALLRWNHPEWGVIMPSKFIPIAEETDLIVNLGDWVLKQACLQNKAWQQAGFAPVRVSVNLSAKQLMRKDLLTTLEQIIEETQLDPKWLEIEITENTLLQTGQLDILDSLKQMGVTLSIDDFGTGYSSLSYIKKLKADVLKMDKSFIHSMCLSREDKAVVKAMIGMAHDLNLSVIAEGVETKEQLYLLQKLKCHEIQGYLFSKPVAPDACGKLLEKGFCPLPGDPVIPAANVPNRRQVFRIEFLYPLRGEMTVEEINDKRIQIGYTEIMIENIGPGGLRFLSTIEFPSRKNVLYKIRTDILGSTREFRGHIVWNKETVPGAIHQNGVEFRMDEHEQSAFIQMLNQLSVQLRRNPLVPNSGFMAVDKNSYLLTQLSQQAALLNL